MKNLVLYVPSEKKCLPCHYVKQLIKDNNYPVTIKRGGYHPLVTKHPTLIIGEASAIIGPLAIESYFKTYFGDK